MASVRGGEPARAARWHGGARTEWIVAGVVLLLYALWIALYLLAGHEPRDFIVLGRMHVLQGHTSALIQFDPRYHYDPDNAEGYDGQYCYFIAVDPAHAAAYMDWPAYRYSRILYPILARLIALGQPGAVPLALIGVNWLALGGGTLAVAAWLKRRGCSPWLALLYGCSTGLFIALQGDLTEPLAYALVALAIYLFDFGGRRRVLWSGAAFALALLTRESTAVFAALYGLALLLGGATQAADGASSPPASAPAQLRLTELRGRIAANWRSTALLLTMAFLPYALYKGFLALWLGSVGVPEAVRLDLVPFHGLLVYWPLPGAVLIEVDSVVLPALVCAGMGLWALKRRIWHVEIWVLLANVFFFVVLLPKASYINLAASARITTGVVLAALLCIPSMDRLTKGKRTWLAMCGALWLAFLPIQALGLLQHH
ncbi:MAG: AZOBR_p60025 family cell surface glycopolymer formation protein [Ktedonobacterales bacterium]